MCVSTPYIVYLLKAKSSEGKADYVRGGELVCIVGGRIWLEGVGKVSCGG